MENQISISSCDLWLLKRLKAWPKDYHKRQSFGAYIVFLVTGNESGDLDWLGNHLCSSQSRFWSSVGSFVFFQRYSLLLRVENSSANWRNRHATVELPLEEIETPSELPTQLVKLVEQGRLASVMDGDQLVVIDPGAKEIGEAFGISGQMPCALVFDVSPQRRFLLYELGDGKGDEFYRSTARAIERFRSQGGFRRWMGAIARFEAAPQRIQDAEQRIVRYADGIPQHYREHLETRLALLRNLLAAGKTRKFVERCAVSFCGSGRLDERAAVVVVKRHAYRLQQFAKTIRCLEYYYRELPWPLEAPWSTRFAAIWSTYVREIALGASESAVEVDRELILQAIAEIRELQDQVIDATLLSLKFTSGVTIQELLFIGDSEEYRIEKRAAETDAVAAVKSICAEDRPSLISAFCVQIPNSEVRVFPEAASRTLAKYIEPYLAPETLLEAIEQEG